MSKRIKWEVVTISITPDQKRLLEERAEREMSSLSAVVRRALAMYLAQPALFPMHEVLKSEHQGA